jgi:hypothetical protein
LLRKKNNEYALVLLCLYGKTFKEHARDEGRKRLPLKKEATPADPHRKSGAKIRQLLIHTKQFQEFFEKKLHFSRL